MQPIDSYAYGRFEIRIFEAGDQYRAEAWIVAERRRDDKCMTTLKRSTLEGARYGMEFELTRHFAPGSRHHPPAAWKPKRRYRKPVK